MAIITPITALNPVVIQCGAGDWVTQLNSNLSNVEDFIAALNTIGLELDAYSDDLDQLLIDINAAKTIAVNAANTAAVDAVNNVLAIIPTLTINDTAKRMTPKADASGWELQDVATVTNGRMLNHFGRYYVNTSVAFTAPLLLPPALNLSEIDLYLKGDFEADSVIVEPASGENITGDTDGITIAYNYKHIRLISDGSNWNYEEVA